jgi:hypothetical protein
MLVFHRFTSCPTYFATGSNVIPCCELFTFFSYILKESSHFKENVLKPSNNEGFLKPLLRLSNTAVFRKYRRTSNDADVQHNFNEPKSMKAELHLID